MTNRSVLLELAGRVERKLTPEMRRALASARQSSWGEWFVPAETRWNVRRRLIAEGFASKRPAMPLTKLGIDFAACLRALAAQPSPASTPTPESI